MDAYKAGANVARLSSVALFAAIGAVFCYTMSAMGVHWAACLIVNALTMFDARKPFVYHDERHWFDRLRNPVYLFASAASGALACYLATT